MKISTATRAVTKDDEGSRMTRRSTAEARALTGTNSGRAPRSNVGRLRGLFEGCRLSRFGRRRRRWPVALAVLAVGVGALGLSACVADPPPIIGIATPGDGRAVVSWRTPLAAPAPITAYVVTPWIGFVRQTPIVFNSPATTQTVIGLTNGVTYAFTVHALNALGNDSAESGMSNPVTPGPHIALGALHTCALVAGGSVKCWGYNASGQLGDGTTTNSLTPVKVTDITDATSISAGPFHTCAVVAGGTVECWGTNTFGQLGDGTTTNSSKPVAVTGITDATSISAGNDHTCAVVAGGRVFCWGGNSFGQLGNGTTTNSLTPVAVTDAGEAVAISAGSYHTCAVLTDGTAQCWGYNSDGQLGNGTTTNSSTPVTVIGLTHATAVSVRSAYHTCAVLTDRTARCWGDNFNGQLGNGTTTDSSTPVAVTGISDGTAISAGFVHTCALLAGGTVDCWGYNGFGQLGNGTTTNSSTPVAVPGITDGTAISAGSNHDTCAWLASGTLECWGYNSFGQLGNGTTINSSTPVAVLGL